MFYRLLCRLGLHRWYASTTVVKVDNWYTVKEIERCETCGKERYVR